MHGAVVGACASAPPASASRSTDPTDPCGVCDPTVSTTDWSPATTGTLCGDPSCDAGVLTPAPTCDASGGCAAGAATPCPSGLCRDATACEGPCADDTSCPEAEFCGGTPPECRPDLTDGGDCSRDAMCAGGFCVDGVCCEIACDGACEACDMTGDEGSCLPYDEGTDPEGECTASSCNGAGECGGGDTDGGTDGGDVTGDTTDPDGSADGDVALQGGGGCGCRVNGEPSAFGLLGLLGLALLLARRRTRRTR